MSANGREIEISELTFRTRTLHPPPTVRYNGPICPQMAGKSKFPNSPFAPGHCTRLRRSDTTARYVRKWPGNRNFRTHLYCAVNESDALDSWKAASDMAPLRADFDKNADILTISTGRAAERSLEVGTGFVAHLGYANKAYIKNIAWSVSSCTTPRSAWPPTSNSTAPH